MTVGTTTHLSLGGHEYLVRPGSYIKRQAPQFGARFTTGDPDFNNLSFWQHWAQQCFVGGVDQDLFADDAMYDEGVGVDTTQHEQVTLSRDMTRGTGANWTVSAGTANASQFRTCIYNNKLYVLGLASGGSGSHLYEYTPGSDGWTRITTLDAKNMDGFSIGTFGGRLYIGGLTFAGVSYLIYSSGAFGTWTTVANPAGVGGNAVNAMRTFQQKFYVAFGAFIWRLKTDNTWDGNTVFYTAHMNSESNFIISLETHLGFLYMLSYNGHVHRTDGNTTFDIWSWDGGTQGVAIKSFDGRLFVLTFEYTGTASVGQGVLYQMSGSAVTQLKRWGDINRATYIGDMVVYDRRLWYGASNLLGFGRTANVEGFGVATYDPIEDAHSILAVSNDTVAYSKGSAPYTNYIVDSVIFFGGYMFMAVRGHGMFKTPYGPHDKTYNPGSIGAHFNISSAGASVDPLNGGWFTTSTYDAGTPGVRKMWRKVIVDAAIPTSTSIVVEYSTNIGVSWTELPNITTVSSRVRTEFWLNNITSVSFKLRFTLRSTSATVTPILYGFVVSYLPIPEPNWLWTFTIVLSERQQASDGSLPDLTVNTESEMAFLAALHRSKQLTTFTDVDGVQWATGGNPGVMIYDIEFRVRDMTQPLESEVIVTLLEAVETY